MRSPIYGARQGFSRGCIRVCGGLDQGLDQLILRSCGQALGHGKFRRSEVVLARALNAFLVRLVGVGARRVCGARGRQHPCGGLDGKAHAHRGFGLFQIARTGRRKSLRGRFARGLRRRQRRAPLRAERARIFWHRSADRSRGRARFNIRGSRRLGSFCAGLSLCRLPRWKSGCLDQLRQGRLWSGDRLGGRGCLFRAHRLPLGPEPNGGGHRKDDPQTDPDFLWHQCYDDQDCDDPAACGLLPSRHVAPCLWRFLLGHCSSPTPRETRIARTGRGSGMARIRPFSIGVQGTGVPAPSLDVDGRTSELG